MNWIDYLLIALVACSFVAGLMRGLLREVIALVTWITAVWVAWHYADLVESHLGGALASESVRTWAARALIFVVIVMVGGVIGLLVSHLVRLSIFSGTDRSVGGLFGLLRGLVMAGLFVMLCHAVRLEGEPWWHRSLLVPYAEHAANVLRAMVGERKMFAENSVTATR
jgi:membrane protein required for colicin V production